MIITTNYKIFSIAKFILITLCLVAIITGTIYSIKAYKLGKKIHSNVKKINLLPALEKPQFLYNADQAIRISSVQIALEKRAKLVEYIFGSNLPSTLGDIEEITPSELTIDLASLPYAHAYKMTIPLEHDFISHTSVLLPPNYSGKAVLLHQGHSGPNSLSMDQTNEDIKTFLQKGYLVALYQMPLCGAGPVPSSLNIDGATIESKYFSHDTLSYLHFESGNYLKLFIEPVIVGINTLTKYFNASNVIMIGLSGGGWTTTIASAIDPRIITSIPVAGSYPIAFRLLPGYENNYGDAEQRDRGMLKIAGYLDLYLLGALENNRTQLQIINKFDNCCFDGEIPLLYTPSLQRVLERLSGGTFECFLDDSHSQHKISEQAYSRVFNAIEN